MDCYLIGSLGGDIAGWFYTWGMVVIGLGMVIFIHELGHFLVAKACGVKCEKFYVGFDVPISIPLGKLGTIRFPRTLWKKQWGETEYGIGILPLGGYVKMLGQDDNPYKQEAEFDRARAAGEAGEGDSSAAATAAAAAATATDTTTQPAGSRWDPRSYLAKSVPQRMAIISAGVIMNVILAFVLSSVAYALGVQYRVPVIGEIVPGSAAWLHEWPVGLVMTKINGKENPRYDKEVIQAARLAEKGQSIDVEYRHPKTGEIIHDLIQPTIGKDKLSFLGIRTASTLQLIEKHYAMPGSPAGEADFQGADVIVAVKLPGQEKPTEVKSFVDWQEILVRHPDAALEVTVERAVKPEQSQSVQQPHKNAPEEKRRFTVSLGPAPIRDLGLMMKLGKIVAVQPNSPAGKAGIRAEDEIVRVTGQGADEVLSNDPLFMPELLRRRAGKMVKVHVMRAGQQLTFDVTLREVSWSEEARGIPDHSGNLTDEPMSAPAMGIAYEVLNEITAIAPGSSAEKSGAFKPGQRIAKVKPVLSAAVGSDARKLWGYRETEIPLGADKRNWPAVFFHVVQDRLPADSKLAVYLEGEDKSIELEPKPRADWYRPDRGLLLMPILDVRVATSFGEAMQLGLQETGESMSMVVTFLRRIPDLWKHAAGPLGILNIAAGSLESGFTHFLLILAVLSANLAVVNILPIPVLDGGHLMFLAYEGIRRKPPSEKVMIGLNFVGLALILGMMVTVLTLDIGRLFGG